MLTTKDYLLSTNKIPLDIQIPKKLHLTENTKLFIYIPNFNNIELSNGKNFENGFWSIQQKDLKSTYIIPHSKITKFQLLLVYKNSSEEEIVSNIYYKNKEFTCGPFITADFTIIDKNTINLRIKSFTSPASTVFEINGLPEEASLSSGHEVGTNTWEVESKQSKNIILYVNNDKCEKLNLSITATSVNNKAIKSTFNLIINLQSEDILPNKQKYKELKINTFEIINKTEYEFDDYILSIKNLPQNCCIINAINLENKWITSASNNREITINNFNLDTNEIYITLEYILLNHDKIPTSDNTFITKIKCDFTDQPIKTKDYTKCITCKNCNKCNLFNDFMDYIGNSTILKHII